MLRSDVICKSNCYVITVYISAKTMPAPRKTVLNDRTVRDEIWHRFHGNEWDAFDQLPLCIRQRLAEHAYDAWSVNALVLWKHYKRVHGPNGRADRALIRYHDAAWASILRNAGAHRKKSHPVDSLGEDVLTA